MDLPVPLYGYIALRSQNAFFLFSRHVLKFSLFLKTVNIIKKDTLDINNVNGEEVLKDR